MKTIPLTVWITFQDPINGGEQEIKEIAENMLNALYLQVESGMGLAPEDEETFTRGISISHRGTELINYEF